MKRIIRAVVMALLLAPGMLWADDLDAGLDAYHAGDQEKAYEILLPLAEQGLVEAQTLVGIMYLKGWGVAQDYVEAVEWFAEAQMTDANAQYWLGTMWQEGKLFPQDYAEAMQWYRLAAEQGNEDAQLRLGFMYYQGQGVSQDYSEAARWYRLAAEQGNSGAQVMAGVMLGIMYSQGQGVIQDYSTAYMWSNIAARNGRPLAVNTRDAVADLMTPEAIAEAQRRARICIESDYQDCD